MEIEQERASFFSNPDQVVGGGFGKPPEPETEIGEAQSLLRPDLAEEIAPETPDGIIGSALGFMAEKVYPVLRPMMAIPGVASAEIQARKEIFEEEGFLTGGVKQVFGGDLDRRRRAILGVDEEAGIRDQLRAGMRFQEERESLFWGEKFITEVLFDPLTYVGVGWLGKIPKAGISGLQAAGLVKRTPLSNLAKKTVAADPTKKLNIPSEDDLVEEGYKNTKLRRLMYENRRSGFGRIPLLGQLIHRLNPSGSIDAIQAGKVREKIRLGQKITPEESGEYLALIGTDHARLTEYMDHLIAGTMASVRAASRTIFQGRLTHEPNDVLMEVLVKADNTVAKKPLGDVIQRPDLYEIQDNAYTKGTDVRAFFKQGTDLLDEAKLEMEKVGIDVGEVLIETAEGAGEAHYWPRFVKALKEVEEMRSPISGRMLGKKATFVMSRIHELQEEGIKNGVKYFGPNVADPFSEVLQTYLGMAMRQVADKRLANRVNAMGSTLRQRIGSDAFLAVKLAKSERSVALGIKASINKILRNQDAPAELARIRDTHPDIYEKIISVLDYSKAPENLVQVQAKRQVAPMMRAVSPLYDRRTRPWGLSIPWASERRGVRRGGVRRVVPKILGGEPAPTFRVDTRARNAALREIRDTDVKVLIEDKNFALAQAKYTKQQIAQKVMHPAGMMGVPQPAFSGRLFEREVGESIMKMLGQQNTNQLLSVTSEVSSVIRLGSLTLDWGFPLLQGAMIATNAPRTWIRSSFHSLKALALPKTRYDYLAKADSQEVIRLFGGRLQLGSNEFLEALQPGTISRRSGIIQRYAAKAPSIVRSTVEQTFGRAGASFDVFFDVARIEMAKGFMPAIKSGQLGVAEVASHINKMSGVLSSRALGVSGTQRELESALLFLAPRWTRAVTGMVGMSLQGGWEGQQAFQALTKFFAGTTLLYVGLATSLGKPIKLDPRDRADGGDGAEFMTVEMGGSHIGFGGKLISMSRLLFRMRSDPTNAMDYAFRWYRGQGAPAMAIGTDIFKGDTYLGDPLRSPEGTWDLSEVAKKEGTRMFPFWAQALIEDPRWPDAGLAGEMLGMRSWPLPAYEKRDNLRDELTASLPISVLMPDQRKRMEQEGIDEPTWDILTPAQKLRVKQGRTGIPAIDDRIAELERAEARAEEDAEKRGEVHITQYFDSVEDNIADLEDTAMKGQRAVLASEGSPREFLKQVMRPALTTYAGINGNIFDKEGFNARAIKELDEGRERAIRGGKFVSEAEQARMEYIQLVVGNDELVNDIGDYNFKEAEKIRQRLESKYGVDVMRDVEEAFQNNKNMPSLYRNWIDDREKITPYWELKENYLARVPGARTISDLLDQAEIRVDYAQKERLKRHPAILRMNSYVRKQRQMMRMRSPEVDALLYFWGYSDTLLSPRARIILQQLRSQRLRGQGQAT